MTKLMARCGTIVTRSRLRAPAAEVWSRIATAEGINDELRPYLRMTAPAELKAGGLSNVVVGERLCRSWVLLLGVLPIDYDDITITRLEPGRGFLEQSTMLSQASWQHERRLEPHADGCDVIDRIDFEPRRLLSPGMARPILAAIFRHRHRRLQRHFGGEALGQTTS